MKKIMAVTLLIMLTVIIEATTIKFVKSSTAQQSRDAYYIDLLELALEKSEDKYGAYKLQPIDIEMVQSRTINEVSKGKYDIVWSMTSSEREKLLRPVRVPILKGLLGHRIFIIKKGNQDKFSKVKTFNDLMKLNAGQGHDWPDTTILKSNNLKVIGSSSYEALFKMLLANRFDYFPRGVNEPWEEVKNFGQGKLTIEKKLLVRYPAPFYYFVNKNNVELAERLEYGLNKAIDDGSFDELFYNNESHKKIFELADMENRIIFDLDNPLLSDETKATLSIDKYWYRVK